LPIILVIIVFQLAILRQPFPELLYDSGGVTTSTVTVPLVIALGVGLASSVRGRNSMVYGFGMIAFASLLPMIFVMDFGMMVFGVKIAW